MKRMLIDAAHPEETRVAAINGTRLEDFDIETSTKRQLKGNIYLAKIIRVEPSLQAAFVDYGGNRHGFLAFSEIHPDYFQIPAADREALLAEQRAESLRNSGDSESETEEEEEPAEIRPRSARSLRHYKIQDVIKRRQIVLVQVVKEERGNKGAALTTYLSLAGRYCVLMPNTARGGGGVSRKITSLSDRRRLKNIVADLEILDGMAVIVRTAGSERTKAEIKRDYEYLLRLWDNIRTLTLESVAPSLVYEEASLIKRAIRDLYAKDTEEILVEGEEGYRIAKDFMRMLTPSHAKKVRLYRDPMIPLFHRYQVESQLDGIHNSVVQLRSGGYIVINPTEALVSIDVNSGRSTKERHIEETALKTNLEAADEVARQLRLRDLAGLVVIDFIDMEDSRNNAAVERRFKEATKTDRARIQLGHISIFGLLELSRQRLHPSLQETSFHPCPHCNGAGYIRSIESSAIYILRVIEEEGIRGTSSEIILTVSTPIALYILNQKRPLLNELEARYGFRVTLMGSDTLIQPDFRIERVKAGPNDVLPRPQVVHQEDVEAAQEAQSQQETPEQTAASAERGEKDERDRNGRRKKRERGNQSDKAAAAGQAEQPAIHSDTEEREAEAEETEAHAQTNGDSSEKRDEYETRKSRRRGKRGGRRRNRRHDEETASANGDAFHEETAFHTQDAPVGLLTAPESHELLSAPEPREALPAPAIRMGSSVEAEAASVMEPTPETQASTPDEQEKPELQEKPGPEEKKEAKPRGRRPKKAESETDAKTEKPKRTRKKAEAAPKEETAAAAEESVVASSGSAVPESEKAPEPAAAEPEPVSPVPDEPPAPRPQRRGWWNRSL